MYAKRKYKLFPKKGQGTEICIHEGIKLVSPFLFLWKYNQVTNGGSGLSSDWMNLQAMALSTANGKGLIIPSVPYSLPGGGLQVQLFPGSS